MAFRTTPTTLTQGLVLDRIVDDHVASRIVTIMRGLANDDSKATRYPGPNPISLDTSHFPQLQKEPYYICEKTDGVRYALVCTTLPPPLKAPAPGQPNSESNKSLNMCCLVDRALAVYVLPLRHVPKAMFQGSVLDGELARNTLTGAWDYLIFDAVVVSGVPVLDSTLNVRMDAVHHVMRVYTPHPDDPVTLLPKTFFPCAQLDMYRAHAKSVPYEIDGVILTPAMPPVVYGRHFGMFKLKDGSRHTVDFLVGADGRSLSVFDKSITAATTATIATTTNKNNKNNTTARNNKATSAHVTVGTLIEAAPADSIVECELISGTQWKVVGVRSDKSTANDMFTYQKTLLNMREALTLDSIEPLFF